VLYICIYDANNYLLLKLSLDALRLLLKESYNIGELSVFLLHNKNIYLFTETNSTHFIINI